MKISKYLPLLGISIFVYIIVAAGPSKIFGNLKNINLGFFFLTLLVIPPLIVIKAIKWQLIIKTYDVNYPLIKAIKAWIVGFAIGNITPGRVGDLSRSLYLKKDTNVSLGKSLTTVVIDRLLDVSLLVVWAILGISIFMSKFAFSGQFLIVFLAAFAVLILSFFVFSKEDLLRKILKPFYLALIPEKHQDSLSNHFNEFYIGFKTIVKDKSKLMTAIVLTVFIWFGSILQYYLLTKALNLAVPFWFLMLIIPPTILVEILPISFSGVGTRDATLIFFLSFIAVTAEAAVSLALTILIGYYIMVAMGFVIWWKNPIKI